MNDINRIGLVVLYESIDSRICIKYDINLNLKVLSNGKGGGHE
jgi:hypothetical protein